MRQALALACCAIIAGSACGRTDPERPFGFTRGSSAEYKAIEGRFLAIPSPVNLRAVHRWLSEEPHLAGSPRDHELARWIHSEFQRFGLDDVQTITHEILLPWPDEITVELTSPGQWRAAQREDPLDGDLHVPIEPGVVPYHAYSASADVTAPVVYAGRGTPGDYGRLAAAGIDVRGRIVLVRNDVPYSYRGFKVFAAEQQGAAGVLVYSDPADDGHVRGAVYPDGPWAPMGQIQRGSVAYDFLAPGDPHTPGWPSTAGARRLTRPPALPAIPSAPLSARDAARILESIGGPPAPSDWQGALPVTYRLGGGPAVVRLRVALDDRVRPVWTVTGAIRGREEPDRVVILGNHRDAWTFGGADPSSGSAALMELARALGQLKQQGWRPRRTILLASWDAEEFCLGSSTEWAEEHADILGRSAVAYINVDTAATGPELAATAVPALNRVIVEAARVVRDPAWRVPLTAAARQRASRARGASTERADAELVQNLVGGGSDYTVFLNHLGIPIADIGFRGPHGVYHSAYDTHAWVARFGDPGFRYHAALVQLWGVIAMRLAGADIVPLDYGPYADAVSGWIAGIERRLPADSTESLRTAAAELKSAAERLNRVRDDALEAADSIAIARVNGTLLAVERALLDPEGLPGRPWYRHQIYAPAFSYAPQVLPGPTGALDQGAESGEVLEAIDRLAAALRRAAAMLSGPRERRDNGAAGSAARNTLK